MVNLIPLFNTFNRQTITLHRLVDKCGRMLLQRLFSRWRCHLCILIMVIIHLSVKFVFIQELLWLVSVSVHSLEHWGKWRTTYYVVVCYFADIAFWMFQISLSIDVFISFRRQMRPNSNPYWVALLIPWMKLKQFIILPTSCHQVVILSLSSTHSANEFIL